MEINYNAKKEIDYMIIPVNDKKLINRNNKYAFSSFAIAFCASIGLFIFLSSVSNVSLIGRVVSSAYPFTGISLIMYSIMNLLRKKKLTNKKLNTIRENLIISLIHYNHKNKGVYDNGKFDDSLTSILNSKYIDIDYVQYVNYEMKIDNMYYILPYKHKKIEYNRYQILLDSLYIKKYDLNNNIDIVNWFKWHFEHKTNFKINVKYDIHKELDFLEENDIFLNPKYDNLNDVKDIRKSIHSINIKLVKLINNYYSQTLLSYDSFSNELYSNMKSKQSYHDQKEKTELTNKIKKQKKYIPYLERE